MAGTSERLAELDLIGPAIAEYKSQLLTPELVNKTWQTILGERGKRIDKTFDVPTCDRTIEELAQLQKENKAVLLIPDNLTLVDLGRMFPEMQSWAVQEGTTIADEQTEGGCIDIEMDLESPHRGTTEGQIDEFLKSQKRNGQRLKIFIFGSQLSKLSTGHYFDEDTWSRLPGSRYEGRMVDAHFRSRGYLGVGWSLIPKAHGPEVGFRSEGVKKA